MITVLLLLAAVGILAWGYVRAKPYGRSGILAWLQTVVLMGPWLLFFGLSAVGIYLNLAGILLLVVSSTGVYIYLGRQLRAAGISINKGISDNEGVSEAHSSNVSAAISESKSGESKSGETKSGDSKSGETETEGKNSMPVGMDNRILSSSEAFTSEGEQPSDSEMKESGNQDDKAALLPIPAEDLAAIEGIFGIDTFFSTKTVPYQEGAIFKGNLRGQPDKTAQILSERLTDRLGDRYSSFLLSDPSGKPVVVVLPAENGPQPTTLRQKVLAVALAIATTATCLETASVLQSFDIFQSPERWPEVLPITLGILAVLGAHEIGHRLMAARLNIKISPPFFLPAWQLGAFGSLMRFESILPNRSVLFDVAFAGPAAGGLLSLAFLFFGFMLSHTGSLFQLPAEFFQGSILVGVLARAILGDALQAELVDVHPLMIIGWLGLIITAINVMPAGQLDGGRMVQAIYGRNTLIRTSTVTLILLAVVGLFNPLALYWAVLIVFLQRQPERPCTDDLSEPDDARAALALLTLFLMLLVLLPLTPSLAMRLGIS
ncbi:MAG: site-2 protease family protein [Phormidesmis sp. RL_2_1]|nr:site-2 protease family protein [Phormidesmis sp. RL_2_1]